MASAARPTKRIVAIVLAIVVVGALVLSGVTTGFSDPEVPSGAVAVVDGVSDGTVSKDDFDALLKQNATTAGLKEAPPPSDPQYQSLVDSSMQSLLQSIWVRAEAQELGVDVPAEDVTAELESTKKQNFGSDKEFNKYLKKTGLTLDEAKQQIEVSLLTNALVAEVAPGQQSLPKALEALPPDQQLQSLADFYGVDDGDVQDLYDANLAAFEQPASREARVILNSKKAQVVQAKKALEAADLSDAAWKKVAAKYSQDQTSKDSGGQLPAPITQGSGDPLEATVFKAPEGELVGPVNTDRGWFLVQVTKATEATTAPLDDKTSKQIETQIVANEQQRVFAEFKDDFFSKWTARTVCAPEAVMQLCSNFEAPAVEPVAGQPAPPAVVSARPIEPGTATVPLTFPSGYQVAQGTVPQGPGAGTQLDPAAQVPAGSVPVGPDGQPVPGATGAAPSSSAAAAAAAQQAAAAQAAGAAPAGAAPTP